MKLSDAVSLYIKLRDRKAEIKAEMDEQIKPIQEKMDKLEAKLLEAFQSTGVVNQSDCTRLVVGTTSPFIVS